jgi:hypothetical protein
MPNTWLKKNPLWLSASNRVEESWRGQATAQAKRQVSAARTEASMQYMKLWSEAVTSAHAKTKPKRKH